MKIVIDAYEANVPQRLGSSQIAFELIKNLEKIDRKNEYTILLPSSPLDDLPKERKGWVYKILKPKLLWTRIAIPFFIHTSKEKFDIFFSPTHYIPRFLKIKKIATIFDLSFLHFPKMFNKRDLWQLKNGTQYSVKHADKIITISNSTKKDIISEYKIDKKNIIVAYPGYDRDRFKILASRSGQDSKFKIEEMKTKYETGDKYIIYVGTIQPRKNLVRLIEVVSRIDGLNLVIVGKSSGLGRQGWMYEDILETPEKLGISNRVIFTGFVPDEELASLVAGSKGFVQVSLYEGFGIPVLEAMASGIPVITSNNSSLGEVAGGAGLLVDPYSLDQIEQAIRIIISDGKIRQKYIKKGLVQAKKFSWVKMAKVVLKEFIKNS